MKASGSIGLCLCFLLTLLPLRAEEFLPIVTQFGKNDYQAANQNWSVGQTSDGLMYFGNNQGLLQFDGSMWELFPLPGGKVVRSLYITDKDRIYVGSFEEFGFFEKQEDGRLKYTSLSAGMNDYPMQNDEIWTILEFGDAVIFQSFTSYFTYRKNRVKGCRCPYTFLFFNNYGDQLYTHTNQFGFSRLNPNTGKAEPATSQSLQNPVLAVLPHDAEHSLLVTKSDGLYLFDGIHQTPFPTELDEVLRRSEVNKAIRTPDGSIVLGTILHGVIALDAQGRKKWILNTGNVLQNNTVLGMFCDQTGNIWMTLDKGIAMVRLGGTLRFIPSFDLSVGSIYSICTNGPNLYLGTNQGLYRGLLNTATQELTDMQLMTQVKGQVWSLKALDGQLFCGNNENTVDFTGNKVKSASPVKGGFCIQKGIIHGREVLVEGTYTDLCIYLKENGQWVFSHQVQGFLDPVRYLEIDYRGVIWASHLHQGLYAIELTPDLKKVARMQKYRSLDRQHAYTINVFKLNNRVVFADRTGLYTYDDIRKSVVPYTELNKKLGSYSHAYRICPFRQDLYWFINDQEAALIQVEGSRVEIRDIVPYALFRNQTVDDYQNVVALDDRYCILTLENGLALYDTRSIDVPKDRTKLRIRSVRTSNAEASDEQWLPLSQLEPASTPFRRNNLQFSVFFPNYERMSDVRFRFRLEGWDKVWSELSSKSQISFSYLPWGSYTLHVEARSASGLLLSSTTFSFKVRPPFYWSIAARIIYLLLLIGLVWMVYRLMVHQYTIRKEKIKREVEERRLLEIEKKEQQIIALENEKLENELVNKSRELASSTMTIIKKNEILVQIKEEVMAQKKMLGSQYPNKYYERLVRMLDKNLTSEDDWAIFQTNFDRIHEHFFRNLHQRFPELTSNDLRLCAYLRLNLSSKDIAHLMNISLKGVELGRYRIRKKIGIPSSKSLTEYMIEFQ